MGVEAAEIEDAVRLLSTEPALMEDAALAVLQAVWEDPASRPVVEGALGTGNSKLPVVELALIAIVAVYGMWLTATRARPPSGR